MNNGNKKSTGKEVLSAKVDKPATGRTPKSDTNANPTKGAKKKDSRKASPSNKRRTRGMREIAGQHFAAGEAVTAYGEIFSMEDALQIARMDLKLGKVSNETTYAEKNAWQYYLGINLWYLVVYDMRLQDDPRGRAARTLITLIRQIGLVATIARCCDAAQLIVQEQPIPDQVRFLVTDDLRTTLQSLRFLKRFTVLDANLLEDRNRKDWLTVEKQVKAYNLRNFIPNTQYAYVIGHIRAILNKWCDGYKPVDFSIEDLPAVPSGATYEKTPDGGSLSLSDRLKQYVRVAHDGRRFLFSSADPNWETPYDLAYKMVEEVEVDSFYAPDAAHEVYFRETRGVTRRVHKMEKGDRVLTCFGKHHYRLSVRRYKVLKTRRKNRLVFVPKSYKTYRVVCPESPLCQMMQRKIRDHLWDCLPAWVQKHLPLRHQEVMEELAACAFALGLSTTDLSHASDSFSVRAFCDAYPPNIKADVLRWRPTHTAIKGVDENHVLQQLSTMGTGNVWLLMAVFLLAAMVAACDICRVADNRRNGCFVFGDDCIHPDEIRDTFYWILTLCGFVVNTDKSYSAPSRYRESCGSEWWLEADGRVTSLRTLYYPRFPVAIKGKPADVHWDYNVATDTHEPVDGLSRLIQLQHKLYWSAPDASEFIYRAVKRLMPSMTVSLAGTLSDDLWGEVEDGPISARKELFAPSEERECEDIPVPHDPTRYFKPGKAIKHVPTWFDEERNADVPMTTRVGHMVLTVECTEDKDDAIRTEWTYLKFLKDGPAVSEDSWCGSMLTERQPLMDPTKLTVKWKVKF